MGPRTIVAMMAAVTVAAAVGSVTASSDDEGADTEPDPAAAVCAPGPTVCERIAPTLAPSRTVQAWYGAD
jgi:hypothetical protein